MTTLNFTTMKNFQIICLFTILIFTACEKQDISPKETYSCEMSFSDPSAEHPQKDDFQALLDELNTYLPGVMVGIRTPDSKVWYGTAGFADIQSGVGLDPCHLMMVGSISKVFTSTTIFRLQDEGKLSIDDPLSQYLEGPMMEEIEQAKEVTLRQMLNHTSGLPDYLDNEDLFYQSLNEPFYQLTAEEKLEYAYDLKANHRPGADYYYSNTNFVLLGLVIEKITGKPLHTAKQDYLFDVLNLQNAEVGTPENPIPARAARPYFALNGDKFIDLMAVEVSDAATGDGGVAINTQDLNTFIQALFNQQLLSEESFTEMTQTLYVKPKGQEDFSDWPDESTGLGIDLFHTPYGDAYGHTGRIFAFSAFMFYWPENGATLTIALNGSSWTDEVERKKIDLLEGLMALMF